MNIRMCPCLDHQVSGFEVLINELLPVLKNVVYWSNQSNSMKNQGQETVQGLYISGWERTPEPLLDGVSDFLPGIVMGEMCVLRRASAANLDPAIWWTRKAFSGFWRWMVLVRWMKVTQSPWWGLNQGFCKVTTACQKQTCRPTDPSSKNIS